MQEYKLKAVNEINQFWEGPGTNWTPCRTTEATRTDLPLGHVLWSVALLGHLVVDKTELAALLPGLEAVEADVELCTVLLVGVLGVGVRHAKVVNVGVLGAGEAAVADAG